MLKEMHIRDFTIVDQLDLEFGCAMNVLTGETGAGKSILLDALSLCLGDRAPADCVRPGAEKAEIHAVFDIAPGSNVHAWLDEHEIDTDEGLFIRRVLFVNGRSRGFINGVPAAIQTLRELGEQLVDIHGQHAHQSLVRAGAQRTLLDAFADADAELTTLAARFHRLREIERERAELEGDGSHYEERLALLRHQLDELEAYAPSAEHSAALEAEQRRLAHADELIRLVHNHLEALSEDDYSAQARLGRALREIEDHRELDPALAESLELFATALAHLEEGCQTLRGFADTLEVDPERLSEVEQRIGELRDLARKHRVEVEALPETLAELRRQLEQLENAETRMAALRDAQQRALEDYLKTAEALSTRRQEAGQRLAADVGKQLAELGMAGAELMVGVEYNAESTPTSHGLDRIELLVRTNPGQAPGPLARVASGGELSRLGLAIQVATVARSTAVPTLVFDEADSGIGGAVAEVVGRLLATLGQRHQVLCVTHLPQVAAQAGDHFRVDKQRTGSSTRTTVHPLNEAERIEELARMLGGLEITAHERAAARKMLERRPEEPPSPT